MKAKAIRTVLALALAALLCGCGGKKTETTAPEASAAVTTAQAAPETEPETTFDALIRLEYENAAKTFMEHIMSGDNKAAFAMTTPSGSPFVSDYDLAAYLAESTLAPFAGKALTLTALDLPLLAETEAIAVLTYGSETVRLRLFRENGTVVIDYDEFTVRNWSVRYFPGSDVRIDGISVPDNAAVKTTDTEGATVCTVSYLPKRSVIVEMSVVGYEKEYKEEPKDGERLDLFKNHTDRMEVPSDWTVTAFRRSVETESPTVILPGSENTYLLLLPNYSSSNSGRTLRFVIETPVGTFDTENSTSGPSNMYSIKLASGGFLPEEIVVPDAATDPEGYARYLKTDFITILDNAIKDAPGMTDAQFAEKYVSPQMPPYERELTAKKLREKICAVHESYTYEGADYYAGIVPNVYGNTKYVTVVDEFGYTDTDIAHTSIIHEDGSLYRFIVQTKWSGSWRCSGFFICSVTDGQLYFDRNEDLRALSPRNY